MRRLVVLLMTGLGAGSVFMTAAASGRTGSKCSVQNAGGIPSSGALGGWSYEVQFACPFVLRSFEVQTNKQFVSGQDKFGQTVPYAYAVLKDGKQANFTCKATTGTSITCTASPALPAGLVIGDTFDARTACRNTKKGHFAVSLTVNRKRTPVVFETKTTNGSFTGACG